jgi:hypothetical protein
LPPRCEFPSRNWLELAVSNGLFPGQRINGILPVRIATDRVRQLDALRGDPDEVRARRSADIPLRRYGEPEEFGRVAALLLSPAASYITGAMIRSTEARYAPSERRAGSDDPGTDRLSPDGRDRAWCPRRRYDRSRDGGRASASLLVALPTNV